MKPLKFKYDSVTKSVTAFTEGENTQICFIPKTKIGLFLVESNEFNLYKETEFLTKQDMLDIASEMDKYKLISPSVL